MQLPCNGHLEHPSGCLVLHPNPGECSVDTGKITNIQLPGTLPEMFDHVEKHFTMASVPEDHMKSEIFKAVKLALSDLPEKKSIPKKLLPLREHFIQHQKLQT